jgi:hypothetical protein
VKGEGMKYDEGIKGRPKERKFNLWKWEERRSCPPGENKEISLP